MSPRLHVLSGFIRSELQDLAHSVNRVVALHAKAVRIGDLDYLDGVALNLHGFYMGVEGVFTRIARDLDQTVPDDPQWHITLLTQMATPVGEIRPPVIRGETRRCLDKFRGFRHVVRNVYTFNLAPSKIDELVQDLPSCHGKVVTDLEVFCDFLDLQGEGL